MLFAKTAAPQAQPLGLPFPIFDAAVKGRLTLFTVPAGYFCSSRLAATLKETARPVLWLRLGLEDTDPATLLLSLIDAARRLQPEVGAATLRRMRQRPGPVTGWPPLFESLGHELAEGLPSASVLILDHVGQIAGAHLSLGSLAAHLLPALPDSTTCILVSHAKVPTSGWPSYITRRGVDDLCIDVHSASSLVMSSAARLPARSLERAITLTKGRADVLTGMCAVADEADAPLVEHIIEQANNLNDLLLRLTHAWLAVTNTTGLQSRALALAARLEYSHPSLVQATLGNVTLPGGPLLQALEADWIRIPCAWKSSLRAALRASANPGDADLRRLADYLASHDALAQAVPLYAEIGDTGRATQAVAQAAETMIDLGQWQTLSHWLDRLTRQAALGVEQQGTPKPASQWWSKVLDTLGLHHRSLRETTQTEGYAPAPPKLIPNIPETIREAFVELPKRSKRTETLALQESGPAPPYESATPVQGAALMHPVAPPPPLSTNSRPESAPSPDLAPTPKAPLPAPLPAPSSYLPEQLATPVQPPAKMTITPAQASLPPALLTSPAPAPESLAPLLTAHVLGTFRVSINDGPIENWPSGRGQAVFKYLLIHHSQPVLRDVLMDVFWPNASPEAVRNRLHVALYGLRQKLRTVTDMPVVILDEGAYRLAPDWRLWLDVDEFSRHAERGNRLETVGQTPKAAAEYESAISLYQGDLLADDPYEEWPVVMREHLRVAYLDLLDRLSRIYFSRHQYAACAAMCQLILARDNCREDAHCLLMRCYSRQGQPHLALRQYQACVEALRTELDIEPTPATRQWVERIRRHDPI